MMADAWCLMRGGKRKLSGILRWHERMINMAKPSTFDKVINAAIMATCMAMLVIFVYTYVITQPLLLHTNNTHCVTAHDTSTMVRAQQRMQMRAFDLLSEQCTDDSTVLTSNQLEVDGEPYPGRIAYLCRLGIRLVDPVTLKRGTHKGKCQETHHGVTKQKNRYFPIVANITRDTKHRFATLEAACEFEHAMERLSCVW